jgi:hypothetical protein
MVVEIIGLAVILFLQSVALLAVLWVMIKIQKLDYSWLPLIGAAFLTSALDLIPIVGHFIAVPVLLLCVWKITRSTIFPDAAFTVVLGYALMRCLGWILLTIEMSGFHATSAMSSDDVETNSVPIVAIQPTNPVTQKISKPSDKIVANISVKGISRDTNSALVTIRYGVKNYIIPLHKAVSISTEDGLVTVRFLEAGEKSVTLGIRGEEVKYAIK